MLVDAVTQEWLHQICADSNMKPEELDHLLKIIVAKAERNDLHLTSVLTTMTTIAPASLLKVTPFATQAMLELTQLNLL
jgi:hypothetical protein